MPIAKSNIFTIYALPGEHYKWFVGENPPVDVEFAGLPAMLKQERDKNPDKIVVVIKVHPEAKFHAMVDIIDDLDALKMNRFALAPLTDEDKKELGI